MQIRNDDTYNEAKHPLRRDHVVPSNDIERDRLGMDTLKAAAGFALSAQRRMEAFNEPDDLRDGAAFYHYDLAIEAMSSVALSFILPGSDSHLGRACARLRALKFNPPHPINQEDQTAIEDAQRAIFGEVLAIMAIEPAQLRH